MRQARLPVPLPRGQAPGPYWSLTFKAGGKTVTRSLHPQQVDAARQQIANYRRYQALSAELVEVSEQLCQARLTHSASATADQAKKR